MKLILVVEDEYGNAQILRLLLETEGYRVASASNGKAALELLSGEAPALIISDFMMPIMNGGEFGEAVRRDPVLCRIPFIMMSATDEDVVRKIFRGYDAFLVKPFEIDPLLSLVQRLVTNGRPPQPSSEEISESMRQLMRGLKLPGRDE
ncbi:response regulator [Variovorax sp. DAIF25]|jgi:CheY-like chemotaxis protein|uniref:response regulator n=1 Tax=Variovorax sp. DAIF25 TaxID=3080983 RepID=UPI003D6AF45B